MAHVICCRQIQQSIYVGLFYIKHYYNEGPCVWPDPCPHLSHCHHSTWHWPPFVTAPDVCSAIAHDLCSRFDRFQTWPFSWRMWTPRISHICGSSIWQEWMQNSFYSARWAIRFCITIFAGPCSLKNSLVLQTCSLNNSLVLQSPSAQSLTHAWPLCWALP